MIVLFILHPSMVSRGTIIAVLDSEFSVHTRLYREQRDRHPAGLMSGKRGYDTEAAAAAPSQNSRKTKNIHGTQGDTAKIFENKSSGHAFFVL